MKKKLCCVVLTLLAVSISGCQKTVSISYIDPDDPYTGWYQLPDWNNTVIPVFKIDGIYCSVCRGFEIPFKQTSEGLHWALESSSMVGTKIVKKDSALFIIIKDQQAEAIYGHTSETEGQYSRYGRALPLMQIEKPSWLQDPTTSPPKSNNDFLGTYQPVWFPYYQLEIQKDSETYLLVYSEIDMKDNTYKPHGKTKEIVPLKNELGFSSVLGKKDNMLKYNDNLQRYEIVLGKEDSLVKIPLVRIDSLSPNKDTTVNPKLMRIGIPTWH